VVERIVAWGEDRILCCDNDGDSRTFLTSWTDYPAEGPENPFSGTIDFWFEDLQMLAKLIDSLEDV